WKLPAPGDEVPLPDVCDVMSALSHARRCGTTLPGRAANVVTMAEVTIETGERAGSGIAPVRWVLVG
ncbi:MAG: hypothetical protein ACRDN0_40665, partial [Trebonia sp.]